MERFNVIISNNNFQSYGPGTIKSTVSTDSRPQTNLMAELSHYVRNLDQKRII